MGILKEKELGNIKKELKINGLVKGNRRAGLSKGSTAGVLVVSTLS